MWWNISRLLGNPSAHRWSFDREKIIIEIIKLLLTDEVGIKGKFTWILIRLAIYSAVFILRALFTRTISHHGNQSWLSVTVKSIRKHVILQNTRVFNQQPDKGAALLISTIFFSNYIFRLSRVGLKRSSEKYRRATFYCNTSFYGSSCSILKGLCEAIYMS